MLPLLRFRTRSVRPSGWPAALVALAVAFCSPTSALVFYATDDPDHNTSAPEGVWAGSGWQWQGIWQGLGGVPIAPDLFLTAKHIGGSVGNAFRLGERSYPTVAYLPDPESDLAVWKVCGVLPDYAPLYADSDERSKDCVIFGRGRRRGVEVSPESPNGTTLKGWRWVAGDGRLRWGLNRISNTAVQPDGGGPLLKATFDAGAGPEEATFAVGDSGSGLFIRSGDEWRLAGINYAVDGPFRIGEEGTPFLASLFDKRGLYEQSDDGDWSLFPEGPRALPAGLYATRISARIDWIRGIIETHSALPQPPGVESAPHPRGPFTAVGDVEVDVESQLMIFAAPSADRFFRLSYCHPLEIVSVELSHGFLALRYE